MPKAILIDDEENARTTLALLLQEYAPEVQVVAQCPNVPEGVIAIHKHNPDIVFLDVEMPDYNGFELLDFLKEIPFEIIFVTAYSQYAIRAFEISAVDYLLKPVEINSLKAALEKAAKKRDASNILQRMSLMKEAYQGNPVQKITLSVAEGLLFVDVQQIVFFEADRAYTHVYLADGSKLTVSKPMRTFEDMLAEQTFMFRPHRSYLVNTNRIRKYLRGESLLVMDNNATVAVSRERKAEFEAHLKELKFV